MRIWSTMDWKDRLLTLTSGGEAYQAPKIVFFIINSAFSLWELIWSYNELRLNTIYLINEIITTTIIYINGHGHNKNHKTSYMCVERSGEKICCYAVPRKKITNIETDCVCCGCWSDNNNITMTMKSAERSLLALTCWEEPFLCSQFFFSCFPSFLIKIFLKI